MNPTLTAFLIAFACIIGFILFRFIFKGAMRLILLVIIIGIAFFIFQNYFR